MTDDKWRHFDCAAWVTPEIRVEKKFRATCNIKIDYLDWIQPLSLIQYIKKMYSYEQ